MRVTEIRFLDESYTVRRSIRPENHLYEKDQNRSVGRTEKIGVFEKISSLRYHLIILKKSI